MSTSKYFSAKKGFAGIIIFLCLAAVLGILLADVYFISKHKIQNLPNSISSSKQSNAQSTDILFEPSLILKTVSFTDSNGNQKNLVIYRKFRDDARKEYVDTYLTDKTLTRSSAIKIDLLSDSPDNRGLGTGILANNATFSLSKGPGKKFIVINYSVGDSSSLILLDQNGQATDKVIQNACSIVKNNFNLGDYGCFTSFDHWEEASNFYVQVAMRKGFTNNGPNFQVLIDANSGQTIGEPKKSSI